MTATALPTPRDVVLLPPSHGHTGSCWWDVRRAAWTCAPTPPRGPR